MRLALIAWMLMGVQILCTPAYAQPPLSGHVLPLLTMKLPFGSSARAPDGFRFSAQLGFAYNGIHRDWANDADTTNPHGAFGDLFQNRAVRDLPVAAVRFEHSRAVAASLLGTDIFTSTRQLDATSDETSSHSSTWLWLAAGGAVLLGGVLALSGSHIGNSSNQGVSHCTDNNPLPNNQCGNGGPGL